MDQTTLPIDIIFYPPMGIGPKIEIEVKLLNEDNKPILSTGPVVVNLPEPVSFFFFTMCIQ